MQCNSMNKNLDQGSTEDCTAADPRLTKSPEEEEKSLFVFSVSVILLASVERFGVSRMRDLYITVLKGNFMVTYALTECILTELLVLTWLQMAQAADRLVEILAKHFPRQEFCIVPPKIHG